MFGHVLNQRQETPLGVKPGIGSQLFVVWVQALDHTGNAKLVVTLCTIQGPMEENTNSNNIT